MFGECRRGNKGRGKTKQTFFLEHRIEKFVSYDNDDVILFVFLFLLFALPPLAEEGDDRKITPTAKKPHHFGEFYVTPQTHMMYAATW